MRRKRDNDEIVLPPEIVERCETLPERRHTNYKPESEEIIRRYFGRKRCEDIAKIVSEIEGVEICGRNVMNKANCMGLRAKDNRPGGKLIKA